MACSSGLSVAFGAPIGGVLFSYVVSDFFDPIGHLTNVSPGNQYLLP